MSHFKLDSCFFLGGGGGGLRVSTCLCMVTTVNDREQIYGALENPGCHFRPEYILMSDIEEAVGYPLAVQGCLPEGTAHYNHFNFRECFYVCSFKLWFNT